MQGREVVFPWYHPNDAASLMRRITVSAGAVYFSFDAQLRRDIRHKVPAGLSPMFRLAGWPDSQVLSPSTLMAGNSKYNYIKMKRKCQC